MNSYSELKRKARVLLNNNILPFWDNKMRDHLYGGFYGRIDGNNNIIAGAPKGGILNARILWTFSAVYNRLGDSAMLSTASLAAEYILQNFFDNMNGGTWWSIDYKGEVLDKKKQIYSQAYFVYALSEYYRASGDEKYLNKAIELYRLIEKYAYDKGNGGYFEAFGPNWQNINDQRLSAKDANEKKSMNTHLHILEAYSNLYSVWPDEILRKKIYEIINLFTSKIIDNKTGHLNLFFDEHWNIRSGIISYGHDIEASWLLCEAASSLGDNELYDSIKTVSIRMANASLEGIQDDGSMVYERSESEGFTDMERHWWVQAEAVVGLINACELTAEKKYLTHAVKCFNYISENLVDKEHGEWYWSIRSDGSINWEGDRAGFWKCPYHNSRMCLEIMKRL